MEENQLYRHFQKPWEKWFYLGIALLEFYLVWAYVQDYRKLAAGSYPESYLADMLAHTITRCANVVVLAFSALGVFLIGTFAKSQRQFRRVLGIYFLAGGLVWAILGLVLRRLPFDLLDIISWLIMLLALFIVGGYNTWKYREKD